jgi:hypothetical protein
VHGVAHESIAGAVASAWRPTTVVQATVRYAATIASAWRWDSDAIAAIEDFRGSAALVWTPFMSIIAHQSWEKRILCLARDAPAALTLAGDAPAALTLADDDAAILSTAR